jgi:hypothetical protein
VRGFQTAVGIPSDGIVGPITCRAMISGMLPVSRPRRGSVWSLSSCLATSYYRKLKIALWSEFQWSTNLSSSFLHCPAHDLSVLQEYVY